jgi:hypothetical protein
MANNANSEFSKILAPTPADLCVSVDKRDVAIAANPTANDTTELCVLPAGCVPVDYKVWFPDLDTNGTPTVALSLGFLNAGKTDLSTAASEGGAVLVSGKTTAQAGGLLQTESEALFKVTPVNYDRYFAVKWTTAAATFAAGTVRAELFYRPA